MRRKDREITDISEMESILREATVCRIGMVNDGEPYVVPVCFAYENGSFYIHSAREGLKIGILRKNPRVCVEIDSTEGPVRNENPCSWEMRYRSVICQGTALFVEDDEMKKDALNRILARFGVEPQSFAGPALETVCVIRIDVDRMTGRKHGY